MHRDVDTVVRHAVAVHGHIPAVRSAEWWSAPASVRLAAILVAGEAWLAHDPQLAEAERWRSMSHDLAGALDWSAEAEQPSAAELAALRNVDPVPTQRGGLR